MKQITQFQHRVVEDKKGVLIGGHPRWQKEFKSNNPRIRVLEDKKKFKAEIVKGASVIYVNTHHISHNHYEILMGISRKNNIPVVYVS